MRAEKLKKERKNIRRKEKEREKALKGNKE